MENVKETFDKDPFYGMKDIFHHDYHHDHCFDHHHGHHHDHCFDHDKTPSLFDKIMEILSEESKERMREDKNLHGILHTVYHKVDGIENVTIKELEKKIECLFDKIPELDQYITDGSLRDILAKYYTKYEIDCAFSTGSISCDDIKAKAFEKLSKYISSTKLF